MQATRNFLPFFLSFPTYAKSNKTDRQTDKDPFFQKELKNKIKNEELPPLPSQPKVFVIPWYLSGSF
jgi:hypothetical protein